MGSKPVDASSPCSSSSGLYNVNKNISSSTNGVLPSLIAATNEFKHEMKPKEWILILLALLLLVGSVLQFLKHWKKNYWDINQLPYYAYFYHKESEEALVVAAAATAPTTVASTSINMSNLRNTSLQSSKSLLVDPPLLARRSFSKSHSHLMTGSHMLLRTSTDPKFLYYPHLHPGTPPHRGIRPRPLFRESKRAASDAFIRISRCRKELERQITEGAESDEADGSNLNIFTKPAKEESNSNITKKIPLKKMKSCQNISSVSSDATTLV